VEVFLKQMNIFILPRNTSFPSMRKPAPMYISRVATVGEFREKLSRMMAKHIGKKLSSE
jgi:hypothetical protein